MSACLRKSSPLAPVTPFAVRDVGGFRYCLLYNETHQLARESRFVWLLGTGVLVITLLASAGGLWLAGRVITPVSVLAERVKALEPEAMPTPLGADRALLLNVVGNLIRNAFQHTDQGKFNIHLTAQRLRITVRGAASPKRNWRISSSATTSAATTEGKASGYPSPSASVAALDGTST
jgi:hypothetical protein